METKLEKTHLEVGDTIYKFDSDTIHKRMIVDSVTETHAFADGLRFKRAMPNNKNVQIDEDQFYQFQYAVECDEIFDFLQRIDLSKQMYSTNWIKMPVEALIKIKMIIDKTNQPHEKQRFNKQVKHS